ncbi:hypothetical protein KUTeg_005865 [Tegillarca granosa]|uniref:Myb-like domain-containing protein n=1 Tax=Tegillarca granosa TaxID=220873 RepID=A0ABQ9FH23_TEGGR|nr:hypothetical protein KUTeg_005865 [Tegillarca granosa]
MPQTSTYLTLSVVQNLNAYQECASNLSRVFVAKKPSYQEITSAAMHKMTGWREAALEKQNLSTLYILSESEMEGQPHTPVRIQTSRPNSRNTMIECETCKVWFDSMDRYSKHPCVQAEPKATTSTADTETGILNWTWTKESTLLLIDEYKKRMELLNTGKMKKKSAWISISKILVDKGYNVTASQCEGRWKTLLRGLKTISDHNKKSGNDKKSHPFAKELEFMAEKPNIKPEYVAGSDETSKTKRSFNTETASTDDDSDQLHPKASTSGENTDQSDVKTSNEPKSKRRKSSSAEVVTVLKDFIQTQQERYEIESKKKEQMHNERMEIFKGFLNLFEENDIFVENKTDIWSHIFFFLTDVCKICMDEQIDSVFIPCGHMLSCTLCANQFEIQVKHKNFKYTISASHNRRLCDAKPVSNSCNVVTGHCIEMIFEAVLTVHVVAKGYCYENRNKLERIALQLKSSIKDLVEKEIELDSVSHTAATHPIRDGIKQCQEAVSACKTFVTRTVENLRAKFSNSEDVKIKSAMCSVLNPDFKFGMDKLM